MLSTQWEELFEEKTCIHFLLYDCLSYYSLILFRLKMCAQKCFFDDERICSGETVTLESFRHEEILLKCFPGAASLLEILLLCDDRFYQNPISLRSNFVCSAHEKKFFKQYWPSAYRNCWLCTALQKTLTVKF